MTLSIIVATDSNYGIGYKNDIPWHCPSDLKRFKNITLHKPCIMGRKTFDSFKKYNMNTLPNRINIVITRKSKLIKSYNVEQHQQYVTGELPIFVTNIHDALNTANLFLTDTQQEVMIIGGQQIYEQTIDMVDTVYHTIVEGSYNTDTNANFLKTKTYKTIYIYESVIDGIKQCTFYTNEIYKE